MTKSPRLSPSIFAYCKQSKGWNGLGMRLCWCCVGAAPSTIQQCQGYCAGLQYGDLAVKSYDIMIHPYAPGNITCRNHAYTIHTFYLWDIHFSRIARPWPLVCSYVHHTALQTYRTFLQTASQWCLTMQSTSLPIHKCLYIVHLVYVN